MAADPLNRLEPATPKPAAPGDLPAALLQRYLREREGRNLAFYVDATAATPAFRDTGGRLSADRNDPNVVRDLVAIAAHRGWTEVAVRGTTAFRRETWLAARAAGLEVRGYTPSERDVQLLERRHGAAAREPRPAPSPGPPPLVPLRIVEAVVRARVPDPAARTRLMAEAKQRLASWLDRDLAEARRARRQDPLRERPR